MMLVIGFLAGMVSGAAMMVVIFVVAVLRMHRVEQAQRVALNVTPVIIPDTNSMH